MGNAVCSSCLNKEIERPVSKQKVKKGIDIEGKMDQDKISQSASGRTSQQLNSASKRDDMAGTMASVDTHGHEELTAPEMKKVVTVDELLEKSGKDMQRRGT